MKPRLEELYGSPTYDLFLDSGIIIQPWPLREDWLEDPRASPYPHIIRAILREGIRV